MLEQSFRLSLKGWYTKVRQSLTTKHVSRISACKAETHHQKNMQPLMSFCQLNCRRPSVCQ